MPSPMGTQYCSAYEEHPKKVEVAPSLRCLFSGITREWVLRQHHIGGVWRSDFVPPSPRVGVACLQ